MNPQIVFVYEGPPDMCDAEGGFPPNQAEVMGAWGQGGGGEPK